MDHTLPSVWLMVGPGAFVLGCRVVSDYTDAFVSCARNVSMIELILN